MSAFVRAGLEPVGPGAVALTDWWPPADQKLSPTVAQQLLLVGLARKP